MNRLNKKYILLIIFDITLLLLSIILVYKIIKLSDNNVKGIQTVILLNKENFQLDTTTKLKFFYEPKPNDIITEVPEWLGYKVSYSINSDGLNATKEYSASRNNETFRIVTMGDSFTFGMLVDTRFNYSERLEQYLNQRIKCPKINNFEVINLGVVGYDLEYSVERLVKRGLKYNPDIVVWLINDWNMDKINEYVLPVEKSLINKGLPIFDKNKQLYTSMRKAQDIIINQLGEEKIIKYQKKILLRMSKLYSEKLLLVVFPERISLYNDIIDWFTRLKKIIGSTIYLLVIGRMKTSSY